MSKLVLTLKALSLILLLSPLAACGGESLFGHQSPSISGTGVNLRKLVCAPAKPITYSSSKDTAQTVKQVRSHDQTYKNLRCPGF